MSSSRPSRRAVLAASAAVGAVSAVPLSGTAAQAASAAAAPAYRWRTAVIGGAYRWDERAARWTALTDHLGWDDWNLLGVEAIAGDPRIHGRVYLATNGRGIRYGEPV